MPKTFFGDEYSQFMDPVHGGVGLLKHEAECIDHPLFQRLRSVMQNDVGQYVFSGATHSRFGHSIGVMHLSGKLFSTLIKQYAAESGEEFSYQEKHVDAIYYVYSCFRLAGLLHDTGHFPFSHEFEMSESLSEVLRDKNVLKDFWGRASLCEKYVGDRLDEKDFHISHEDYSLAVAYKILSTVKRESYLHVEIDDVLCLMENSTHGYTDKWLDACGYLYEVFEGKINTSETPSKKFISDGMKKFFSLMISGEVDVDKMDYLLRDSYFSGAKYGVYNVDHLLSTLRVGFDKSTDWVGVAILEKGIVALEDFVYSRFQIYQNMWSHKAVVGMKLLLSAAIQECVDENMLSDIREHMSNERDFSIFTDHYFMEKFREEYRSCENEPSKCRAVQRFLFREKYNYLGRQLDPRGDSVLKRKNQLSELVKGEVVEKFTKIKFSKISSIEYFDIKVIEKNPGGARELKHIADKSKFFEKFKEMTVYNFYEIQ